MRSTPTSPPPGLRSARPIPPRLHRRAPGAACQNIKNQIDPKTGKAMYTIYTIQVNTSSPADPTSTVLQNCASSPDKFFMLTSSPQIVAAFNSIGTQLSQLRVSK